ncbi:HpcH/HpaI aldolase family protein [Oryzobacter sp. R7]|uniref:HpcH/HpaI aldolase family protein n=1 Tax=Oryzobacter faecalis TaxID=3388656 RepID=UPI00398CA7D5
MDPSRGVWTATADVDLVLRLAASGFDWVALDAQHGPVDRAALHALARALHGAPVPFLVRVPGVDPAWIGAALDAGALAAVVPSVTGTAQAEVVARAARYAPAGERSWGPFPPMWGSLAPEPATADAAQQCWVMVETAGALTDVDDIAALAGVDGLFVGPLDLALSLGVPVDALLDDTTPGNPLSRVVEAGRRHGVLVGAFAGTPGNVARLRAHGIGCLAVTTDAALLALGAAAVLAAVDPDQQD